MIIEINDLLALVSAYNPRCDADQIRRAYEYGERMHEGQMRQSGEPYFSHPVSVAAILTEQRLDDASIITALLHDTIEDTEADFNEISALFGVDVAKLVDGVTKLTNLELGSSQAKQAENFRKLVMAMSEDVRVLLVKLADRLHNMRTIKAMTVAKQVQKAHETMDIYAPLAGRMGMQSMREELEDLSFRVLNPEGRSSIMRRFINLRNETGDVIPQISEDIAYVLEQKGVSAEVVGREKKPYSIWRKMQEKKEGFHRLSDIYGFRIITSSVEDCYSVLGAIHQRWSAVPGRFKDYISNPKTNGYRSIHTTVSGRKARRVEVQIRTREMHQVAETGVAAHWSYKNGERFENPFAVDPFRWLHTLTTGFEDAENPEEFLEDVKMQMFTDQVFCFTPNGQVIQLPRGATPLDFAYAVHTNVGDNCVGAKVDGKRVPMWHRLRNGQSVAIITADGQRPTSSWEDFAVTGKARAAIRRALRRENRESFIRLGSEIARIALERIGKTASAKALATAAKQLTGGDRDELLSRLGQADLRGADLVRVLYPELDTEVEMRPEAPNKGVIGLEKGQDAKQAACCRPLPGERVIGILVKGEGVRVHAIDCDVLEDFEEKGGEWIDLRWPEGGSIPQHLAVLELTLVNDAGVLGRICTLIGEQKANICDITFTERKPDFYRMVIEIEVRDVKHLLHVQTAVEADSDVTELLRYRRRIDPSAD
jgi:RelA/SpoT family (p)ppGpp synthetase